MNRPAEPIFTTRPTVILELPLDKNARILHPEQVILKISDSYNDLGAFCYAMRSEKHRKPGQPCEVELGGSFLQQRPKQVLQLIKALSSLLTDGGMSLRTAQCYASSLRTFLNWADTNGLHDCLSGGDATRKAYAGFAEDTCERYRRQEIGESQHNNLIRNVHELLEATTGLEGLYRSTRKVKKRRNPNGGTEPLAPHDFAHAVALNQALFDGLSDLVLEKRPFPYKLMLPASLEWAENHLWLFPTQIWRLPPHQWGNEREKRGHPNWACDYAAGRLATPDEIAHRYANGPYSSSPHKSAREAIRKAQALIDAANDDERNSYRMMLAMFAHNAFLSLFFCNTGANEAVARQIETDGEIDANTLNQQFRSIKHRAGGKSITLTVPTTFMPSLRRFMELRRWLLNGKSFPYLFFTLGHHNAKPPRQIVTASLESLYANVLRSIDPQLPRMGSRKLRASVADWYQRNHDVSVTAKVLQNTEGVAQKNYDAGSTIDQYDDLSLFLNSVSESAKRQRVTQNKATDSQPLEEGGCCDGFGHPEALADHVPVKPDCKSSQGCLFCVHRVLVACEEDARKVASAAFVMEQVIFGPKHEEALRPLILKCDNDLKKIADFGNCSAMVERVRKDVFQNSNLTPFFADKYQLFLELGVIA